MRIKLSFDFTFLKFFITWKLSNKGHFPNKDSMCFIQLKVKNKKKNTSSVLCFQEKKSALWVENSRIY